MREPGDDSENEVVDLEARRREREQQRNDQELAEARALLARHDYVKSVKRIEGELEKLLGTSQEIEAPARWTPVDELLGQEFPQADWLIKGLIPKDTLTIIGADPKASKTWTLLELALAIGTGEKAFGEFPVAEPDGEPVLLFLNEDTARSVRNRFRALAAGRDFQPSRLSKVAVRTREPFDLCNRTELAKFIVDVLMAPVRPALIGLDPLRNLHAMEENSSTEMRMVLRALGAIREFCGCALAVVHHSNKKGVDDPRTAGARLRGSSAIDGYRDSLISLEKTVKGPNGDEITNQVTVDLKAYRGAGMFTLSLRIEDDEHGEAVRATWERAEIKDDRPDKVGSGEPALTKREEVAVAALAYFRELHAIAQKTDKEEVWVTESKAIADLNGLTGAVRGTVLRALSWLVEGRKLVKEPVPSQDPRGRGKGRAKRWQYRLADDATEPPEGLQ